MGYPLEAKHCSGRESVETIIARYQPQLQWQMLVTGARKAALSIVMGANEPIIEYVDFDEAYASELWRRAEAFMECVRTLTPPVALAPIAAPVIPVKIIDMQGNNAWGSNAVTWITTKQAAVDNKTAEKNLKELMPTDAAKAHGHGVVISRNRAGALSLREQSK